MGDDDWIEVRRKNHGSVFNKLSPPIKSSADDLAKVSTLVYISNFPSHLTVRELWNICEKKGTLADVFIANHKNKMGDPFGLASLINKTFKKVPIGQFDTPEFPPGKPDHRLILLKELQVDYGPTPFKFFHSWLEMKGFKDLVEQTWKNDGIINDCKMTPHALLSSIDVKHDLGTANEDDFRFRKESLKILGALERVELVDISQKKKWRQLAIRGILKDGNWIEDPSIVKSEFLGHFMARFQQSVGIIPVLDSNFISPISQCQRDLLERPFSRDEIKLAVWDCGGDKAPGPDGFSFKFFTFFWDLVKNDVVNFVHEFFHTSLFPQGCNSSFIALIPKVANAKTVSDFRPISLIGCQYKIIGKLLATRIRVVIGDCVNPVQSAFIKGRNILDGPLILNEVISWYRNSKKNLMVFKVDFEKALDSIRWDYLDLVLEKLGFGCRWRSWIKGCFHSTRSSVLVNGTPTNEFELHRGLRQGDPLSPFLFILAMEGLHAYTSKAESLGLFKGCSVGRDNLHISHLMYADDVVFIREWSWSNARNLISMLRCFFLVSELRINIHKSLVIGIGVSDDEKFYSKLSSWKARLLSVGGRLTLIRKVGNGHNTSFWFDVWYGNQQLKALFLRIFNLDLHKRCSIANRLVVQDWSSVLRRRPRGGAESVWSLGGNEGFSVASIHGLVDSVMLDNGHDATPWNQYLPIKVNVFVWRLMLNRLPSRVNLDRRNIEVDSLLCPSCLEDVETTNHTFFNCGLAKDLWALLAKWWELDVPVCGNFSDWKSWLDSVGISSKARLYLDGVGGTLLWSIWNLRNCLVFSSSPPKKIVALG
nr:putative RNA-directed DNA polymerase, eukaryota, reverse transcriptase zinc-binding domain protein [Tanacetum cinerariifolium]